MKDKGKHILGLDLGTTSIGFAHVIEHENITKSEIKQIGVRVNPLTADEQTNFEKGKAVSVNADRTLKRGARRNLDRYQMRRKNLIEILSKSDIINPETKLAEDGTNTTHETWQLRSKAAIDKIELNQLARVLLAINKKRGYKSSRKARNEDEGQVIDGMTVAKKLYEENITPGQLTYQLLKEGKRTIPDFYRSDLQAEFDKVWNFQKQFHPEILTNEFYDGLQGKGQRATSTMFWVKYQFNTADIKGLEDSLKTGKTIKLGLRDQKKLQAYKWRNEAVTKFLEKEQMAFVITDINNNINNSSGYLGAISDRSKELFFNKQTVGQYLYNQLRENPHTSLKNQVFYRQDYLDEFEVIWNVQSKHHPQLTDKLKAEVRDIVIFYQRKLKSQKGLISFCEFESKEKNFNGNRKTIGLRVAPKSSPLFQEFKIWQILNNVLIRKKGSKKLILKNTHQTSMFEEEKVVFCFDMETKNLLFQELNIKGNLSASKVIETLGYKSTDWEVKNYNTLEGNRTNQALYEAYLKILDLEGYDVKELLKVKSNKDEVELGDLKVSASEIKDLVKRIFETLNIDIEILEFNAELEGKEFERQSSYQLWHLLYSYEGDDSKSGNEKLYELLESKFGFKREHAQILANITLSDDYGNLSTKAMRKIYPFIKENQYSTACEYAGYRHSKHSLTKEEITNRPLKDKLELLKKNSLRNPVVEKILNQMINVVNTLIEKNSERDENGKIVNYFKFDEIRIELARELKKNAKERAEMASNINAAKQDHEKIFKLLRSEFGVKNPTRNDIIRYRLYEELRNNGYKDLYSNTYISREALFSKQIDIDHIIPQAKLFDDSFSNKTVVFRKDNIDKGNKTAFDYIESKYGSFAAEEFIARSKNLFDLGQKNKEEGISKAKFKKLLKRESEISDGFIERDLRDSQYIAKKAKEILFQITRSVVPTTGRVTDRLREDWGLVNIMKEINLPKYRRLGLTEMEERKFGQHVEIIKDWTKRNDHRHHAMDALTVAFTKHGYIQYLNYLNARRNENHKLHNNIIGIESKETEITVDDQGNKRRVFKMPIPSFREQAKSHLDSVLVSHKAKNKVVTKNKNWIKTKNGKKKKIELTPRGQLHKETVYGRYRYYVNKKEKIGIKFTEEVIQKVTNPLFKQLLLERLQMNGNDPKRAFAGKNALNKNPIYLNGDKAKLPDKVNLTWREKDYSIRKDITPENFKDNKIINKVLDVGVKRILLKRLSMFDNDPKKAFSDLDKNPIWLNQEKGIAIKRVAISGVKNAEALHHKKDHLGRDLFDKDGKPIPVDFVNTGNNHHVAIYQDEQGNLQETVVSFYEAAVRVSQGVSIIDKDYNQHLGWRFLFTLKQNEMFVFPNEQTGFDPSDIDLMSLENYDKISPNLFRVQKFTIKDYFFRHHLETSVDNNSSTKDITWKREGLAGIIGIVKVRLSHLGEIIQVGEY